MYPTKKLWETWNIIRWVSYSKWDLLEKFQEWCVTLLRANNINNWLNTDELQFLPKELINSEKILQKNDIIFCMSSWSRDLVWKNTIIPKIENYSFGAFCSALRLNKDTNPYFISYFLQTTTYKNYIRNLWKWWNILNLRNSDLQNLPIPLPPLPTQQKIVFKLDFLFEKLDQAITLTKQNLASIEELNKSILEKIFTECKEKYEKKKLGEVCEIIWWWTPKTEISEYWKDEIVWLSPTDLPEIWEIIEINNSAKKISKLWLEKSSAKILPKWTVIFSSRATIWKIAISTIELSTNQWFANFICSEKIFNKFLAYTLKNFTKNIINLSNSTTFKEVNKTNLRSFQIPLPPLSEQQKIVEYLDNIFAEHQKLKNLYQAQIKNLDEMKQSFLKKAFAGELV